MSHRVGTFALASVGLLAASVLFASEPAGIEESHTCEAQDSAQARSLGDALMKQRDYQRAGQCYVAAGEYDLANRAFMKGTGPAAVTSGHEMAEQRQTARALLHQVRGAFRGSR